MPLFSFSSTADVVSPASDALLCPTPIPGPPSPIKSTKQRGARLKQSRRRNPRHHQSLPSEAHAHSVGEENVRHEPLVRFGGAVGLAEILVDFLGWDLRGLSMRVYGFQERAQGEGVWKGGDEASCGLKTGLACHLTFMGENILNPSLRAIKHSSNELNLFLSGSCTLPQECAYRTEHYPSCKSSVCGIILHQMCLYQARQHLQKKLHVGLNIVYHQSVL